MTQEKNEAELMLEKIEKSYSHCFTKFWKEMEMWEHIAENINDSLSNKNEKELAFWKDVMELYKQKYK